MIEFYDNDMSVCAQKVRLVLAEKNLKQLARLEPVALEAHYAKMPDEKRRAHVRALVERGLEAPGVGPALRTYRKALASMADALSRAKWLAGDTYSLADITMLPYVLRLEHLGLDGFWTDLPRIQDWFEAARARPAFEAIQHHLDPQYLAIMIVGGVPRTNRNSHRNQTMSATEAHVIIPTPARYMSRLSKHFEHRVAVHREDDRARIDFEGAPCSLVAHEDVLEIRIEAQDPETLERVRSVVDRHLKQVAAQETFEIEWREGSTRNG